MSDIYLGNTEIEKAYIGDTLIYEKGGSGGGSVQSDWNQTNSTANDYIKNKPEILSATYDVARTALVIDIPSVTEQLIEQQLSNL